MSEKKEIKISLSTALLIIAIVIIAIIGLYIMELRNNKEAKKEIANNINNQAEKVVDNVLDKIDNVSNTISSNDIKIENNNTKEIEVKTNSNIKESVEHNTNTSIKNEFVKENNIFGQWNTYQVFDANTGEKEDNLKNIFGTSYSQFGSYIKLNTDNTFIDSIYPINNGENSCEGTFEIKENYYKLGDCVVFLKYSDGIEKEFKVIYYEDTIPVLSYYDESQKMQYDLKK